MKIVLFLSHWLALPSLEVIHSFSFLAGIVIPERDNEVTDTVGQMSLALRIPVFTMADSPRQDDLRTWLSGISPDACFVLTFPFRIATGTLSIPPLGFFNFHCGLLPGYRGIEPIFWQIRNGERFGGITVLRMDAGFDTGEILLEEKLPIEPSDTYGLHVNKLAMIAMNPVRLMIDRLLIGAAGAVIGEGDPSSGGSLPARKRPTFSDLVIDWEHQTSEQIRDLVRASNPAYRGAVFFARNIPFTVMEAEIIDASVVIHQGGVSAGSVAVASEADGVLVGTSDGRLLRLCIISCQDGVYSGSRFESIYGIQPGESFSATRA